MFCLEDCFLKQCQQTLPQNLPHHRLNPVTGINKPNKENHELQVLCPAQLNFAAIHGSDIRRNLEYGAKVVTIYVLCFH